MCEINQHLSQFLESIHDRVGFPMPDSSRFSISTGRPRCCGEALQEDGGFVLPSNPDQRSCTGFSHIQPQNVRIHRIAELFQNRHPVTTCLLEHENPRIQGKGILRVYQSGCHRQSSAAHMQPDLFSPFSGEPG